MSKATIYLEGINRVLKQKVYFVTFVTVFVFLMWLFIYIPVRSIPGNDFAFQMSLLKSLDILLLLALSLLTSLSLVMNMYSFRHKATVGSGVSAISQGGLGGLTGVAASIFGTASCSTCVVSLFGFLGIGTVFLLIDYKNYIVFASIMLILFSLYFTSKKILNLCEECNNLNLRNHTHT